MSRRGAPGRRPARSPVWLLVGLGLACAPASRPIEDREGMPAPELLGLARTPDGIDPALTPAAGGESGRGTIDPETVRRRAAALDPAARLIALKANDWRKRLADAEEPDPLAIAQIDALAAAERLARIEAAADALTTFFQLWEARTGLDLARRSLASIDRDLPKVDDLIEQGLLTDERRDELGVQRRQVESQRIEAELAVAQLNDKLARRIGAPSGVGLLPQFDREASRIDVNPERAVAEGLALRPEGPALDRLANGLDAETSAAARSVLGTVSPLLAVDVTRPTRSLLVLLGCIDVEEDPALLASLRTQILALRRKQTEEAIEAIRAAARTANVRRAQSDLARRQAEAADSALETLRERDEQGLVGFQEILESDLEAVAAELADAQRESAYRQAQVQLGRAQARLDRP